jgi:hypothetical protein
MFWCIIAGGISVIDAALARAQKRKGTELT